MKAAILNGFNEALTIETVKSPECPKNGVIVKIHACGVCRSDHHAWKGADPDVQLPHIMGHEFAGEVLEIGPECRGFSIGDRVTAPFILGCGHCSDCRSGNATICETQEVIGFTYWGAFAEQVAIGNADFNLVRLPDRLSYVDAAGMGCRVTTAWRALTDRAQIKPGEWLVVHGAGGVGLSAIMIGASLGCRVLAVDISDDALVLATKTGANQTLNISDIQDVGEAVREITKGGAHVSVDGVGIEATFNNSLRSLRKLGRHVQVGMPVAKHSVVSLELLDLVYARQLSLHGMRGLDATRFTTLFEMIDSGRLDPGELVSRRVPLSQVGEVLAEMDGVQTPGITVVDNMNA